MDGGVPSDSIVDKSYVDETGIPVDDVDQVFDYLENISSGSDSGARYHLRSRAARPLLGADESGALSRSFLGSQNAFTDRFWINSQRFAGALAQQKKSWEPNFADRMTGYLLMREPVAVSKKIILTHAVIGNYSLGFGSGLLFSDAGKIDRTQHASALQTQRDVRGSLSVDPSFTLFGGTGALQIGEHALVSAFYSRRSLDARISNDSILTLYAAGDHRTDAELAMKGSAQLAMTGARVAAFTSDGAAVLLSGGLTGYHASYNYFYTGTVGNPFYGKAFDAASADIEASAGKLAAQVECAITSNDTARRVMSVIQAAYHPSADLGVSTVYRHIPLGVASPFGRLGNKPLGSLTNEDGYYLGIDAVIIGGSLRASAFTELSSEILPVKDVFPKQKHDYQIALHSVWQSLGANLTVRSQKGEDVVNTTDSLSLPQLLTRPEATTTTRLDITWSASNSWVLAATLQNSHASADSIPSESGWLGKMDCRYTSPTNAIKCNLDVARFSTSSFHTAQWLYDASVTGAGRFVPLYGNGFYALVRLQAHAAKWLTISAAFSETLYDSDRLIGSGLTSRVGRLSADATVQIDLLF